MTMLVKWRIEFGDDLFADSCKVEELNRYTLEVIGRTIVESMLLYAGAESFVDTWGNMQLRKASAKVEIEGF